MSLLISVPSFAATNDVVGKSTVTVSAYNYPIKPGTDEWKNLANHEQKLRVCQIPDDVLHNMSTEALVDTVLNYPLLVDMSVFDTYQKGFEIVSNQFNGISELSKRKDAGSKLLAKYKKMKVADSVTRNSLALDSNITNTKNIEILLGQNVFIDQLSSTELKDLKKEAQKKYLKKSSYSDIYASTKSTFYDALAENQSKKIEFSSRATTAYVKTPNGTSVEVVRNRPEFTTPEKNAADKEIKNAYPNVTRLRSASNVYNCHSYAWYSTSATNNCWMNDPSAYINDGSYKAVSVGYEKAGNKVYYNNGEHSAILKTVYEGPVYPGRPWELLECTSKWGQYGLYNHRADDCPYTVRLQFFKR